MAIIMVTFAFQLKTQPQMLGFRHFLLLAALCVMGCQDSSQSSEDPSRLSSEDLRLRTSGIVASMESSGRLDIPADGQRVGDVRMDDLHPLAERRVGQQASASQIPAFEIEAANGRLGVPSARLLEQMRDPSIPPQVREVIQRIQLLRGSEIQATGAAEFEVRRRRNFRIIDLATRTLPVSMSSPSGQDSFLQLIRFLLEARLELAVSGNADDIQSLYADVKALTERDANSKAAAEGVYTLARFAHEMVRRNGEDEPVWFDNFCQWAREFANRFPDQKQRATALLLGSARSCELRALEIAGSSQGSSLMLLATENYRQLVSQFSDSIAANEATAVLRRLSLPGKQLSQFSGQTLDLQPIDGRTFVDVVTVVYFWDVNDPEFSDKLLPLLQQAAEVSHGQLRFVGVALTDNQFEFTEFLQRHHVPGIQMFGADPDHRGWNHPLIRFWGLSRGSTCWLIKRDRTVAAVDVTASELVNQMRALFPSSSVQAAQ